MTTKEEMLQRKLDHAKKILAKLDEQKKLLAHYEQRYPFAQLLAADMRRSVRISMHHLEDGDSKIQRRNGMTQESNVDKVVSEIHQLAAKARLLGHKTTPPEEHISTPLDLHKEFADGWERGTTEALARIPFIDRREASSIRVEVSNKKAQIAAQEADQTKAEQIIVKLTGKIAALRPPLRKYQQALAKQPHLSGLVDETAKKIATLESDLVFWKKDLDRLTRIVDSHKKLLKEFLSLTPGKGFPTNGEMLVADDELKKLEREAANALNALSF